MFRKNALKVLIFSLCAMLIAPIFSLKGSVAKANQTNSVTAPRSYEFAYQLSDDFEDVTNDQIIVKVDDEEVYKDGVLENNLSGVIKSITYADKVLKASFTENGTYVINVTKKDDDTITETFNLKVSTNVNDFSNISYKTDIDSIKNFDTKVKADKGSLKAGDEYTVISFEEILNVYNLDYTKLAKTIYYAVPGSSNYLTTSDKIEIKSVGTYLFYAEFNTEELVTGDENSVFSITNKNLVEKVGVFNDGTNPVEVHGFYMAKLGGNQVYAKKVNNDYKYYVDKEYQTEISESDYANVDTSELIIPIFSFEITNSAPSVKVEKEYQENGYIGYEYTDVEFVINGTDYTVSYLLEYSENGEDGTWVEAEEELSSSLAFTPTKKGYYRVTATVIDSLNQYDYKSTKNIYISDKFTIVEFKTSFSDWLSVNTVPFIFLCISAAALIGLIVVIAIPVNENATKVVKAEEKDE